MNNTGDLICQECIRTQTIKNVKTIKTSINQENLKRKKIEMVSEKFSTDNLHLKIDEHSDNLKNKVDLHLEELIKKKNDPRIDMAEKIDHKRKELIESIDNFGFQQLSKEKFSEETVNISYILEKLDIEDNYLSNIAKMELQIDNILDQLDKNKSERNNTSTEKGILDGILKLTEEKIQINATIRASEDIGERDFKNSHCTNTLEGQTHYVRCLQLIDQFT